MFVYVFVYIYNICNIQYMYRVMYACMYAFKFSTPFEQFALLSQICSSPFRSVCTNPVSMGLYVYTSFSDCLVTSPPPPI